MDAEIKGSWLSNESKIKSRELTAQMFQTCKVATIVCNFQVYFYRPSALKELRNICFLVIMKVHPLVKIRFLGLYMNQFFSPWNRSSPVPYGNRFVWAPRKPHQGTCTCIPSSSRRPASKVIVSLCTCTLSTLSSKRDKKNQNSKDKVDVCCHWYDLLINRILNRSHIV